MKSKDLQGIALTKFVGCSNARKSTVTFSIFNTFFNENFTRLTGSRHFAEKKKCRQM